MSRGPEAFEAAAASAARRAFAVGGRAEAGTSGEIAKGEGPVVYWMHREHRCRDNWGLAHAQALALSANAPLVVAYCLAPGFLGAALRQYDFLLRGLALAARELAALSIPFAFLRGDPPAEIVRFARDHGARAVVTDFDSLRLKRQWIAAAAKALSCPVREVDSRNVCPAYLVSDKREYMARTIRPKIHRLLPEFLTPLPEPRPHPVPFAAHLPEPDFAAALAGLDRNRGVDRGVAPVDWAAPGTDAGLARLDGFIASDLSRYTERNDPNAEATSRLSPWLHFGMLSAQRAALAVARAEAPQEAKDSFLEELVVRRELADNFCLHAPDYDSASCFPDWARQTLEKHAADPRPHLYDEEALERGETHDPLWNAAQRQMLDTGHMHGWLRMYWAKKILEWTPSAAEALRIGIRLNDRHQLDGREANGYAGLAWSMGGVHDRPWGERPVYGTVRSMTLAGAMRKFDVKGFAARFAPGLEADGSGKGGEGEAGGRKKRNRPRTG
ncbi:DNA photolyase FAD-binding protein [Desulfovibrio sp. X2]|uniref:deoxyribodipyrimidine photo-lyase n=1 Tax=Desulfovibrio sp. X2 TaxID=941449 RepID=UPI0003586F3F|nr:deoxyribodipyrimidine photo-lyase [Desulfovibrio sp. X2]EPR40877.1 DNA photolyase FAD-binding protein [Desulfovibrio sp. X2]